MKLVIEIINDNISVLDILGPLFVLIFIPLYIKLMIWFFKKRK